jgi:gamma-glutamyltranspeptidase/glutathione hydrolase
MLTQWPFAKSFPIGDHGMVATKHPLAAEAGAEILRRGGSAIDAAITASFVLGVVEPALSGIGGGGLALYQPAGGTPIAVNFGMRAPASSNPDMFEVVSGEPDSDLFGWPRVRDNANVSGPHSIALPCHVPGLYRLWELGGTLPWNELVQPAISLAGDGFPVDWLLSLYTVYGYELLSRFPTTRATFLSQGRPLKSDLGTGGETLYQTELAETLAAISTDPTALERGVLAESMIAAAEDRFSAEELHRHQPLQGDALTIDFADLDVHLVPDATGGATVLEWLGIFRALDPPADEQSLDFWWAVIRAGEVALYDRLDRLADPAFVAFPSEILDAGYHGRMAESLRAGEVAPLSGVAPDGSTSHVSACDARGNVVTVTQTLLSGWGSGVVTHDSGILLNNGMMWFDPRPGRPNSVAAGKLPLANMCPVLVTKNGTPFLAYGASGGRKILPAVVQILLRVALFGQSLDEAIAAPRIDLSEQEILVDIRFGREMSTTLSRRLGRPVHLQPPMLGGSPWASPVGLIRREDGTWTGGADLYTNACVVGA